MSWYNIAQNLSAFITFITTDNWLLFRWMVIQYLEILVCEEYFSFVFSYLPYIIHSFYSNPNNSLFNYQLHNNLPFSFFPFTFSFITNSIKSIFVYFKRLSISIIYSVRWVMKDELIRIFKETWRGLFEVIWWTLPEGTWAKPRQTS